MCVVHLNAVQCVASAPPIPSRNVQVDAAIDVMVFLSHLESSLSLSFVTKEKRRKNDQCEHFEGVT